MDRRQRKTRKAIVSAFEELVAQQPYGTLSVGQVIERADVSRSTFYAHFAGKDDLLDQLCDSLFAHVFEGVTTDAHTHGTLAQTTLEGTLCHLLYHVRDSHQGICGKLLAEGEPRFSSRFQAQLSAFLGNRLPEHSSWVPRDLLQALVVSGFGQVVAWWHAQGYEQSPEQLSHWYLRTFCWQTQSRVASAGNGPLAKGRQVETE